MIVNNLSEIKNINFFAIIIGSGPSGITTALQLEKQKINSLIIEAGDYEPTDKNEEYLRGKIIGDKYNDLTISRLRQFGGSSGHWGGNCNPMSHYDLNSWPIDKNNIDKYSDTAKKILNLDYKENFFLENFSDNLNTYNIIWSNVRFGEKYLDHIKKSKHIYLSINTNFVNLNGDSNIIDSINCIQNKKKIKLKSKYYVLSCGGIENSRMLLWSKEINKSMFDDKLPIGKYYMDHPYHEIGEGLILYETFISYFKKINSRNIPTLTCNRVLYFSGKNKFLEKRNIKNSGLYFYFDSQNTNNIFKQVRCIAPNFIKKIYENLKVKDKYKISIATLQEQEPKAENKITLGLKRDPNNIPYPLIYWKKSSSEKKSAKFIAEEISKIFIDNDIGRISLNDYLYNNNDYETIVGNHQLGGTRIGEDNRDSVVDRNLKVHGKKNLFINGSSVFRTGGHCHPTYTIVKLAARLGDYLSARQN